MGIWAGVEASQVSYNRVAARTQYRYGWEAADVSIPWPGPRHLARTRVCSHPAPPFPGCADMGCCVWHARVCARTPPRRDRRGTALERAKAVADVAAVRRLGRLQARCLPAAPDPACSHAPAPDARAPTSAPPTQRTVPTSSPQQPTINNHQSSIRNHIALLIRRSLLHSSPAPPPAFLPLPCPRPRPHQGGMVTLSASALERLVRPSRGARRVLLAAAFPPLPAHLVLDLGRYRLKADPEPVPLLTVGWARHAVGWARHAVGSRCRDDGRGRLPRVTTRNSRGPREAAVPPVGP
jgi:hypothetical protein